MASILRVSTLKSWINRSYASGYLKKGFDALKNTCILFLFVKNESVNNDELEDSNDSTQQETQASVKSCDNLTNNKYYNFSQQSENDNESDEIRLFQFVKKIDEEITVLSGILTETKKLKKIKKTRDFWLHHKNDMPYLYELQLLLLNIPASSSFIERFFSISGFVCDVKRLNMKEDLIIMRSLMKANMNILKELNQIQNNDDSD